MNVIPNIDLSNYERAFTVIDTHTQGEFTRIVLDGMPKIEGSTMVEKRKYLQEHYSHLREALLLEPRGHKDCFGAIITEPCDPRADFGIVFMESTLFTNMCGHGTIGFSTAAIEAGLVEVKEPYTYLTLEAPAGLIEVKVKVENKKAVEVTLTNVPSFVYKEGLTMRSEGRDIQYDIAFGGQFFAMIDAAQYGMEINNNTVNEFIKIGYDIIRRLKTDPAAKVRHPELDIASIDAIEFYGKPGREDADVQNVVTFGHLQADRSPCGTGTGAKLACLYKAGKIEIGQELRNESFMGTIFKGRIKEITKVGEFTAVVPEITGSANITGVGKYIIDQDDPLKYGFTVGIGD